MKKILYILSLFTIFGCEKPEKLVPSTGNTLNSLSVKVPGGAESNADLSNINQSDTIYVDIEGSVKTDMGKILVMASVPNNSVVEPALQGYKDLSKPFDFKVIGADGEAKKYTLVTSLIATSAKITQLYKKSASELEFVNNGNNGVAISGKYFVTHSRTDFNFFNIDNGTKAGKMSWDGADLSPFPLNITSDDKGAILSCNFVAGSGSDLRMYKWKDVSAKPELLFSWQSDADGNLGRKIYVKGDIDELAYIYLPVASKNLVLLWEVKKGVVSNAVPERILCKHPNNWGLNGKVVPVDVSKASDFFTIGTSTMQLLYVNGANGEPKYISESYPWLGSNHGIEYVNLKGAQYVFQIEQNAWNWMTNVFRVRSLIKDPASIKKIDDIVYSRVWNSWEPFDKAVGPNTNATGDVKAQVAVDGNSAVIVFLGTNMGVKVMEMQLD